jgi:DNA-binding transcriptional regulator YiaG
MAEEHYTDYVPYVLNLPDHRQVFVELPGESVTRDRSGDLLLRPSAVRYLEEIRALAMRRVVRPSPAYLITLRQALELTQEEFGEALGVDKLTVSRWERGTRRPSQKNTLKIREFRDRMVKSGVDLHTSSN